MVKALPKGRSSTENTIRPGVGWADYARALFRAFYSGELYIEVNRLWRGLGLRYLFLLSVVLSVPWASTEYVKQAHFYNDVVIPAVKQLPPIHIQDGEVQFDKPMPYMIKDQQGKPVIIIDTTEKIKSLKDDKYSDVLLLITKDSFVYQFRGIPPTIDPIKKEAEGKVSAALFLQALENGRWMFMTSLYPVLVLSLFSTLFVLSLLYGFIAIPISISLIKYPINYRQSIKLTAVAMTPMSAVLFILYLGNWVNNGTGVLLFLVMSAYYIFAVRANKHAPKSLVVSQ